MGKVLEKAYNCYIKYITNIMYGKTDQNYDMLYGATILLKNNITDEHLVQCFDNKLICSGPSLNIPELPIKLITWIVSPSVTVPTEGWREITVTGNGMYPFLTDEVVGMSFLYISIPRNLNLEITDGMNQFLYDSRISTSAEGQNFELVGSVLTSKGIYNSVYRKKDVYASEDSIYVKVKIY